MFKKILLSVTIISALMFCNESFGQFSIKRETNANTVEIPKKTDERFSNPQIGNLEYTTDAIAQAARRKRIKERNTLELNWGLAATQTYFSNWAKGGDNTFSGRSTLYLNYIHTKDKLKIDTKVEARYGLSVIDTSVFKNEDEFKISTLVGWKLSKSWSYAASAIFRSQFADGYKSRTDQTLLSSFMAPAVLDLSVGFNFKPEKSPFNITISPITGSILFVLSDTLSRKGINGITPGDKIKPTIGPSVNINFDKTFAKGRLRYRSNLYSFYNFSIEPQTRWENTFTLQATKFLSTTIYWLMIYDKSAITPQTSNDIQLNYSIGVGLTFNYKNK